MRGLGTRLAMAMSLAIGMPAGEVIAAQWEFTPRIGARTTYSDNVDLDPSGEEESDLITELRPGFGLSADGRRFDANLNYTLQGIVSARGNGEDEVFQQLNGSGELEVLRETFFIEASARQRQSVATLEGGQGDNVVGGNRQDSIGAEVSPYLVNRWGRFAESELRFRHSRTRTELVDNDSDRFGDDVDDTDDTRTNTFSARLDSGSAFQRFTWSLGARDESIEGDDDVDTGDFRSADARVGWQLTRSLQLSATGGYEDDDFETTRDQDELSDTFWDVGATWRPNRRTSLEARFGERFFGETTTFNASWRGRSITLTASRVETISSQRDQILLTEDTIEVPINGQVIEIPVLEGRVVNEFFVDERTTGAITYTGRRLTATLSGFQRDRSFERSDREEEELGASLGVGWQLGASTGLNFRGSYSENTVGGDAADTADREDELYSLSVTVDHRFGENLSTFGTVRHQTRESDDRASEYDENAIIIGLDQRF